jgi:hypothetical protein
MNFITPVQLFLLGKQLYTFEEVTKDFESRGWPGKSPHWLDKPARGRPRSGDSWRWEGEPCVGRGCTCSKVWLGTKL